jgi:hypothetical protein
MDMYGLDEIEEELEPNTQPTIEDVKKIVDSKRIKRSPSTTYTKEDRIKNLEKAREIKKKSITKPNETQNKSIVKSPLKPESNIDIKPTITKVDDTEISSKSNIVNENIMNELQKLFLTQNEILEKINAKTSKARKPREPKPKIEKRVLDLTVDDNEIKSIIENKEVKQKQQPSINPKLKAFLDALQKN